MGLFTDDPPEPGTLSHCRMMGHKIVPRVRGPVHLHGLRQFAFWVGWDCRTCRFSYPRNGWRLLNWPLKWEDFG
jgi:hypothetical protein